MPAGGFVGELGEGVARDVVGGDLPAVLGEPDRVGALAGADVEGPAGGEAVELGGEGAVGLPLQVCSSSA
ncbi:hypothetical protein GCM10027055_26200 [Janibacter alkaliphilus]